MRPANYALTTAKFGLGDSKLIWETDNFGKSTCITKLRLLAVGGFFVQEDQNGLFDVLPFFLVDMAPQGFGQNNC